MQVGTKTKMAKLTEVQDSPNSHRYFTIGVRIKAIYTTNVLGNVLLANPN